VLSARVTCPVSTRGPRACIRRTTQVTVLPLCVRRIVRGPLEDNQLLWIAHRQRTKKGCVDETENRGVGADAEGQSKNRGGSEGRRSMELAEGKAETGEA